MIDTGKEQSENLIKDFVHNVLDDNIDSLKDFSFLNLNFLSRDKYIEDKYKDKITPEQTKIYGDYIIKTYQNGKIEYYNRNATDDYDTMNLSRAICYILFCDKLPNLTWEDLMWEIPHGKFNTIKCNYRGETINTFQTLIDENGYKEFFKDIPNSIYIIKKIETFLYKVFSIGNFMLLPNKKIGSKSLNTYKGDYNGMRDYSDTFFKCILNIENNETINKLKETNSFWYNFKDKNNIKKFIEDNYLQDYFNDNCELNYSFSHHDRHGDYDKTKDINEKYIYALHICEYIDTVTELINKRADRMIIDLKKIINKES